MNPTPSELATTNHRWTIAKKRRIFLGMKKRRKRSQSVEGAIFARILGTGRGYVFTPSEFLDLGGRWAVYSALARAARDGRIRKLTRGLYDYPRIDSDRRVMWPATDAVLRALKGREATRFQPSGAHAANVLGLSEQVPLRVTVLTDGKSRTVTIGPRKIVLKHATPRQMATAGKKSGTIIHALKWLGATSVDASVIRRVRAQLTPRERKELLLDARSAPVWMTRVIREIAEVEAK